MLALGFFLIFIAWSSKSVYVILFSSRMIFINAFFFFSVERICNFLWHRKRKLIYGTETFRLPREGCSGTQEDSQGDGSISINVVPTRVRLSLGTKCPKCDLTPYSVYIPCIRNLPCGQNCLIDSRVSKIYFSFFPWDIIDTQNWV